MTTIRNHQRVVIALGVLFALTLGTMGCAEKITGPGESSQVAVTLDLKAGPAVSFRLTVSAADIDTIQTLMAFDGSSLTSVVNVPMGASRHFVVEGLDLEGDVLYRGETTTDLVAIQPLVLEIDMPPVVPMIYLNPHFLSVEVGSEFVISVCANDLVGLRDLGFGFSLQGFRKTDKLFATAIIDTVILDPSLEGSGITLQASQEGQSDVFVSLFTEGGTIVDEEGDACLVNIFCSTQDTWQDEPVSLIPQMFLENFGGVEIPGEDIYLDTARLLLYRDQAPESYLGTEGQDVGMALVPTGGGNHMLAGATIISIPGEEVPEYSLYLAELDGDLQPRFETRIPWTSNFTTFGLARGAGGFYAISASGQSGGEVMHVDNSGAEIWRQDLGFNRLVTDVDSRPGGGMIASGLHSNDGNHFFLAAFEPNGEFVTYEPNNFSSDDYFRAVVALNDGTFIAAGTTEDFSSGVQDMVVGMYTLTDAFATVWERRVFRDVNMVPYDLVLNPSGGFLVVGQTSNLNNGPADIMAVMHDADGFSVWERSFEVQGNDTGTAVTATDDGGFVITGYTSTFSSGPRDIPIIKLDAAGNLIWQRVHGGPFSEQAQDIVPNDGGFLLTGTSNEGTIGGQDILMLQVDNEGR